MKNLKQRGFTIVEMLIVILVITILVGLALNVISSAQARARDKERQADIRLIHQRLEIFYTDNGYYPHEDDLGSTVLTELYPAALSDPFGNFFNDPGADYTYAGTDCTGTQCNGYTLQATAENEADFVRTSAD